VAAQAISLSYEWARGLGNGVNGTRDLLGYSGVRLAGDAFDARIVRNLVSCALESHSEARSLNKIPQAVQARIYANLEGLQYVSFLRTNLNVREILKSARGRALHAEKIEALIAILGKISDTSCISQRIKFAFSSTSLLSSDSATAGSTFGFT
jgi:hypothetical chaperone protein